MLLYLGPGIGAATIVIVFVVLAIVLVSFGIVLFRPIKRLFQKKKDISNDE